jgi:small multidrug resistance family-3 protein
LRHLLLFLFLLLAALLEVGGDAAIRKGLRGAPVLVGVGVLMLGGYGLAVNLMKRWDFSRLLGVYVAVFALVGVLWGRFLFKEDVPAATWWGVALIVAGGLVIQFGAH